MPRVVLTGGPGVGKTSLLLAVEALGYAVVRESAREIIRERKSQGLAPRPDPVAFASAILQRDLEKYAQVSDRQDLVFFDRSPFESLAMLNDVGAVRRSADLGPGEGLRFHKQVFLLPPWEAIYLQDEERDHSFEHCELVHAKLQALYLGLGFNLLEVPRLEVQARVEYVLRAVATVDA